MRFLVQEKRADLTKLRAH